MPILVLRTATSDTHCEDLYGCDCAVIELRRPLVKTLCERVELAKLAWRRCHAVSEITFSPDYHAAFYSSELITACEAHDPQFVENWDCNGFALVPNCVGLAAFEPQATEAHDIGRHRDTHPGTDMGQDLITAWRTCCHDDHRALETLDRLDRRSPDGPRVRGERIAGGHVHLPHTVGAELCH